MFQRLRRPWLQSRVKWHSLSSKLVLLFVAFAILIVVTVGSVIAWSFRNHFEEAIHPHLTQYIAYIQSDLGSPPDEQKARALADALGVDIHYISATRSWATQLPVVSLNDIKWYRHFHEGGVEYGIGHLDGREYFVSRFSDYSIAFSIPYDGKHITRRLIPVLLIVAALVLLYFATKRLFSPIEKIKEGVASIGEGELSHRLVIKRRDELGELAVSINAMTDDIAHMLEAKRQLLLAISHELRTPLTRAKVATALLQDEAQAKGIEQDLNEMESLIAELLEIERLNTRHAVLNKDKVDLLALVEELVHESFKGQRINLNKPKEKFVLYLDAARIKLMIKNILDNALKYTPEGLPPAEVTLFQDGTDIKIIVQDYGHGIATEHLPHLAEAFYRTDKARQRKTGGYGLGLYLCKVIIQAHGGRLDIQSEVNRGTTVVITIPNQ